MKKKTKVSKKKLDSLLLVLLLTAVLLIMSTYAWFTANRTVSIGNLDVRIETQSGLQISADAEDWKTVLELKDLQDAAGFSEIVNQLPTIMEPVSTALEKDGNRLKMFYGETNPESETSTNFVLTSKLQDEVANEYVSTDETPKGRYIAFDIYLKSGNPEKDLYMSGNVVELGLNTEEPITNPEKEKGITNASRIAIIPGTNNRENAENPEWLRANLVTNGTPMIWEPNNDYHTEKAIEYDKNTVKWNHGLTIGAGNSAIAYDGLKSAFEDGVLLEDGTADKNPDKFAPVNTTWSTTKSTTPLASLVMPKDADGNNGEKVALAAGVTKYRVYMWIEGQDIDCENYASGSRARYTLNFSLDPTEIQVTPNM